MTGFGGNGSFGGDVIVWSPKQLWFKHKIALIVWEVIDSHLSANPPRPLPEWCLEYLRETARGIVAVEQRPGLTPDAERAAVWKALGFGGQGQESSYRKLAKRRQSINTTLSTADREEKSRNVSLDRARRIINEAKGSWEVE